MKCMIRSKPLSPLSLLIPLILYLSAAGCSGSKGGDAASNVASFSITDFKTDATDPVWTHLDLSFNRTAPAPNAFKKKYNKADFATGDIKDVSFLVEYGHYTIGLNYYDKDDKLVYQECEDESKKDHVIDAPKYTATIQICFKNSNTPAGTIDVVPSSEINIKTNLVKNGGGTGGSGSGSTWKFWVDPYSQAKNDLNNITPRDGVDARRLAYIANQGAAVWYGEWTSDISAAVSKQAKGALEQDAYAVMVPYWLPNRDCGQHSAGGATAPQYRTWITKFADAIGAAKVIVVLEPDSLALDTCLSAEQKEERAVLIRYAVGVFKRNPNTRVYLDGGHAVWRSVEEISSRLIAAGVDKADGFALNVSNYQTTASNLSFGEKVSAQVGGKHFVIDTSRNGNGPNGSEWCNPRGRALGQLPSNNTGNRLADAFLWLKRPGESDGACNGGPGAGAWWREIALEQAANAGIK